MALNVRDFVTLEDSPIRIVRSREGIEWHVEFSRIDAAA